jgi:transposase
MAANGGGFRRTSRPFQTVYGFFARWHRAGVISQIRDQLRRTVRRQSGRNPNPVTMIIDTQSVKGAETVGKASCGYDPAKKINGRKRCVLVDGGGLLLAVMVTPADRTDRDIARDLLWRVRLTHPELTLTWADSAYSGTLVGWARDFLDLTIKIVSRPPGQRGFVVLPRRWVVERTLSWIMRARRNCRDYERLVQHSEAHISWSAINVMTRRLTRRRTGNWTNTTGTRRTSPDNNDPETYPKQDRPGMDQASA